MPDELRIQPVWNAPTVRRVPFFGFQLLTATGGQPPYTFWAASIEEIPELDRIAAYTAAVAGTLTVSPETQRIEWNASNIQTVRVYVTGRNGRKLFAESPSGSAVVDWIGEDPLRFELIGIEHNEPHQPVLIAAVDYDGKGNAIPMECAVHPRPGRHTRFVHGIPPGLILYADGVLGGAPAPRDVGVFVFAVTVSDAEDRRDTTWLVMVILDS